MLEQLARDVTGWNARVVEFFQWLETSQYMNHIRPENRVTADLRDWEALERRDTAFNTLAHSVDMRHIETQKGRYNIPNVGLFLWRLDAFSLTQSPAFRIDDRALPVQPARQRYAAIHPARERNRHHPSRRADQRAGADQPAR